MSFWTKVGTNATKGKVSTILGSIVILVSIGSVLILGRDWADAVIGIGAGVGLIGLLHK
jgi:hypothetical protein